MRDRCFTTIADTEKIGSTTRSEVLLMKYGVFGNVVKHYVKCFQGYDQAESRSSRFYQGSVALYYTDRRIYHSTIVDRLVT